MHTSTETGIQRIRTLQIEDDTNGIARSIVVTECGETVLISTIRLIINHGWDGRPLFYETMVFTMDEAGAKVVDWLERDSNRYETEQQAVDGHSDMVTKWVNSMKLVEQDTST